MTAKKILKVLTTCLISVSAIASISSCGSSNTEAAADKEGTGASVQLNVERVERTISTGAGAGTDGGVI